MAYTSCTTGTVALYTVQGDDEQLLAIPVEAWDDSGVAYVAGIRALIAADTKPGFLRLEQASQPLARPGRAVREPVRVGPEPAPKPRPREPEVPPRGGGR